MRMLSLLVFSAALVSAQPLRPGSQAFRSLAFTVNAAGDVQEVRSAYGTIEFFGEGAGTYQLAGFRAASDGPFEPFTASGAYTTTADRSLVLPSPLRPGASLTIHATVRGFNSYIFAGADIATAGSTEVFVSVPRISGRYTSDPFVGRWKVAGIEFPAGSPNQARIATFEVNAASNSAGAISIASRSLAEGGRPATSSYPGSTYSAALDGTGSLTLGGNGPFSGTLAMQMEAGGPLALLGSSANGRHGLWIAARYFFPTEDDARSQWNGQYRLAGLRVPASPLSVITGSLRAAGTAPIVSSLRTRTGNTVLDSFSATLPVPGQFLHSSSVIGNVGVSHNVGAAAGTPLEFSVGVSTPALSGSAPFCNPFGVLNAASFAPSGAPLAPGSFVTLFGTGLAPSAAVATSLPFPTTLSGVRVEINGVPAPLYAVSPTQISALIPLTVTGAAASFAVVNGTQRCTEVSVPLAATSPGIFTVPPAGTGPAALLHADYSLVSATAPARRGETVQLFLTGLGAVTPAVNIAAVAPASPLSLVNANVQIRIGGQPATVTFKGLAPGLAGLYQVNFTVPLSAPAGSTVPIEIVTPNASHAMTTVAIQ